MQSAAAKNVGDVYTSGAAGGAPATATGAGAGGGSAKEVLGKSAD